MKISSAILLVLALLGGLSSFLSAGRVWDAHQKVKADFQLAGLAQVKSHWYEGTIALSFERSVTQVALALDSTVPPDFMTLIEQQRRQSDSLLEQALAGLEGHNSFENAARFRNLAREARAEIAELRREANVLLARASTERNPDRARDLPYEIKMQIENLHAVTNLLVLPQGRSSTQEFLLNAVQSLAWEIREYGGRARTFYAIATLTEQPIPAALTGEAYVDNARAKAAWHKLQITSLAAELPVPLLQGLKDVAEPFAETYLMSLDRLDAAMADINEGRETPMPYTFNEFFAQSNTGLDAVASITPLAGNHIQKYWAV